MAMASVASHKQQTAAVPEPEPDERERVVSWIREYRRRNAMHRREALDLVLPLRSEQRNA
jgi:hypothetical protein